MEQNDNNYLSTSLERLRVKPSFILGGKISLSLFLGFVVKWFLRSIAKQIVLDKNRACIAHQGILGTAN